MHVRKCKFEKFGVMIGTRENSFTIRGSVGKRNENLTILIAMCEKYKWELSLVWHMYI